MIAASMRPDFNADSRYSVRFSSISSGISRRALVQRRNQVGEQVRRDGVNGAETKHSHQLVAPGLRDIADVRRLLEDLLRLLDDALADGRYA